MMWVRVVIYWLLQPVMTVLGCIILPFFMTRVKPFECINVDSRPNTRFKDKWIDAIFGNINDGNEGDAPYKAKYKGVLTWWTRFNWCAFRNPVNNLKLWQGVDEEIIDYQWDGYRHTEDRVGREGFVISYAIGESGKIYPMLRWCKLSKTLEVFRNVLYYIFFILGIILNNNLVFFRYDVANIVKNRKFSLSNEYIKYSDWKWESNIGIECNIGYKNFNIVEFPKHYKYSMTISINPFKKFESKVG